MKILNVDQVERGFMRFLRLGVCAHVSVCVSVCVKTNKQHHGCWYWLCQDTFLLTRWWPWHGSHWDIIDWPTLTQTTRQTIGLPAFTLLYLLLYSSCIPDKLISIIKVFYKWLFKSLAFSTTLPPKMGACLDFWSVETKAASILDTKAHQNLLQVSNLTKKKKKIHLECKGRKYGIVKITLRSIWFRLLRSDR